jgi:6-phosphofructokinase 2
VSLIDHPGSIGEVPETMVRALRAAAGSLAGGDVFLVKPSLGEFRALTGEKLEEDGAIVEAAGAIVSRGEAQHVPVTMGREDAILVDTTGALRLPALPVEAVSIVGAGDSFLAGMVHALADDQEFAEAFRFGMAAGAAAVLRPGTSLALAEDIRRLHGEVSPIAA